jgi:recombination associated protein RdgC
LPAEYPKNVDFLDLWQEKMFLGQEFLTWLWLTSEMDDRFTGPNGSRFELRFEKRLVLEAGAGQSRAQVACQDPDRDWTEAFVALGSRKKLVKANAFLQTESFALAFCLPADTLSPQLVKQIRVVETTGDEGPLSQVGRFLNQASLIASLKAILDFLYRDFLKIRLSDDWLAKELPKLRDFVGPRLPNGEDL